MDSEATGVSDAVMTDLSQNSERGKTGRDPRSKPRSGSADGAGRSPNKSESAPQSVGRAETRTGSATIPEGAPQFGSQAGSGAEFGAKSMGRSVGQAPGTAGSQPTPGKATLRSALRSPDGASQAQDAAAGSKTSLPPLKRPESGHRPPGAGQASSVENAGAAHGRQRSAGSVRRRGGSPVILQVLPDLGAGGAPQTAIDMAAAVSASGGTALVASRGGFREKELKQAGGKLIRLPVHTKNGYGMLANVLRLAQVIDLFQVDLVHARSRAPAWSALAAARIAGKPFLTTYHGTYSGRTALKRFYNSVMVRGDGVIANSHFIANHIVETHKRALADIDIIPRGIDTGWFDPEAVSRDRVAALRNAWNVPGEAGPRDPASQRIILMPGRLTAWKGQSVLLDALARLKAAGRHVDNWTAVFVGDAQGRDSYAQMLQDKVKRLNMRGRVIFHGHCDDMPAAYLASDVVICPSTEPEAFGRVPVEAQAMGRPIIATDHGGAAETVIMEGGNRVEGPTGWRTTPGDAKDLARAIEACLDLDLSAWKTMGAWGQANVRVTYALETMKSDTLAVYSRLLGAGTTRTAPAGAAQPVAS